jgi:hypothetical protein
MHQQYAIENVSSLGTFCIRSLFALEGWRILLAIKDAGYLSALQWKVSLINLDYDVQEIRAVWTFFLNVIRKALKVKSTRY